VGAAPRLKPAALPELRGQLARYGAWLRPHLWSIAGVLALSLLGIAVDLIWPLASAYLVDRVILSSELAPADKVHQILLIALTMVVLFCLGSVMSWVRSLRTQLLSSRLAFALRSQLFARVLRLPLSDLSDMKTGGILSRLSTDVDNTSGLLQQGLISPLLATLRLAATLAIVFFLNAKIAAAVMLVIPPVMLIQGLRARRMRPIWRSLQQDRQEIDGRVSEGLSGVRVVRGFRGEKREELKYTLGHHTVIRKQLLATHIQRSIATVWELIMPLTQLTILCFGGYLVIQGNTTLGVLVAFQGYVWRIFDPIIQIATSISGTQRGLAAMDRVFEVLDKPPERPDTPEAIAAPTQVSRLEFDNVSFEYVEGRPVLHNISLSAAGGSVVALVGPSGAGKTTLTDLLARFADPTSGSIKVNGHDLRQLRLKSYRALLGVVSQEVFLFDGSIRDNIAYGRPGATDDEIRQAAARTNAHEFIAPLPEGYDSVIGERGVKLSGGQRQRLSIARALLADPQILILDEATSNLDTLSEQLIQDSMRELLKNRTTFVIAHRLSTIAHADQIVVLDAGRTVEIGTHPQLMASGGPYRQMVERQRHRIEALVPNDELTAVRADGRA
jgi:ATP-binding cassette subfamily B protein/subfamily B ATP-binding cassette protein MsbA